MLFIKKNILLWCILILILIIYTGHANAKGAGGQAAAFLRLGVGARAVAMGNAYTALTNDVSSVYWNPAGLGSIKQRQLIGMYSLLSMDRQHSFLAYANPFTNNLSIGIGWIYFGVDNIDGRDINGISTGQFNDMENAFFIATGYRIAFLSFGVTVKYLYQSLASSTALGYSFDSGLKINLFNTMSLGVVAQDLGGKMHWNSEAAPIDELPLTLRGGVAFESQHFPISISTEMVKTENEDIRLHAGTELRILKVLGLRAGYNNNELAFGGFVVARTSFLDVQFDYAYGSEVLREGAVHRVEIMMSF